MTLDENTVWDYLGGDNIRVHEVVTLVTQVINAELTDGKYTRRLVADVLRYEAERIEEGDHAEVE